MTEESKTIEQTGDAGIQQINLSYDKVQDRLLFRVGLSDDSEVALWFTYQFTRQLWAALNREAHLPTAEAFAKQASPAKKVKQFAEEAEATEALEQMDFATEYAPRTTMRNDGAMLATEMTMSDDAKRLEVACLEGMMVNINLTRELILAICNMLQLSAKEAGWELAPAVAPMVIEGASDSKVLH